MILVNHKPLLGLINNRELGSIDNPRLQHLAKWLLRWTFTIEHVQGKFSFGPDALSRSPISKDKTGFLSVLNNVDDLTKKMVPRGRSRVLSAALTRRVQVISWVDVQDAGIADDQYAALLLALQTDHDQELCDATLAHRRFRSNMTTVDGIALCKG